MKPFIRTLHVAGLAFGRVGGGRDSQLPNGAARCDVADRGRSLRCLLPLIYGM